MEAVGGSSLAGNMQMDSSRTRSVSSLRTEVQTMGDKINELEIDRDEHQQVIAALEPLPPTRRCWRRIGGVLVESDVASILPTLHATLEGIEKALVSLRESLQVKTQELTRIERELGHGQ